jgi:hypothetical protein
METPLPPLPTFLIIGAQKSATRWLRVNLGEHPDIYTAPQEVAYFNKRYRLRRSGLDWYREQFVGWAGEPVVGEATPGYMMLRHDPNFVAKRINRDLPDVRLIAILRNPIDRAQSALWHHVRRGRLPAKTKLVKVVKKRRNPKIEQLGLIKGGLYWESLRPYIKRFDERLLVVLHDEVVKNPARAYRRALGHVGAAPAFLPPDLNTVIFSNRGQGNADEELTLEERCEMWSYFEDDVRRLQRLLGRNLQVWNPNRVRLAQEAEQRRALSDQAAS